jgi:hypothetical protein
MNVYARELVQNLLDAEMRGDIDDMAEFENEILNHIDWTGDCEQGLTPEAAAEIQSFIDRHKEN